MENQKQTILLNKHTLLDDIQRFVFEEKHILLITSTPSVSKLLKHKLNLKNVYEVTGANNNEFKQVVEHIKNKTINVLVLGIEQCLNEVKRDIIFENYAYVDVVMVDNIHQISQTNFDYHPEYENLTLFKNAYKSSNWFLYAYTLSQTDFQVIHESFPNLINRFVERDVSFDVYPAEDEKRLAYVLSLAKKHSVVCITHDYVFAEIFANQLNRFIESRAIHRKVEETKKVASIIAWQNSLLSSIVITSDTIVPYPYPHIDYVVWLEMPVSKQQIFFYHQLFHSLKTILSFNKEKYSPSNAFIHQFAYNNLLNNVVQLIQENPTGLTLKEVERKLDGDTYVLEKAMKGLKAFKALKKEKLSYVIDQPYQLSEAKIQRHETIKKNDFNQLYNMLHRTLELEIHTTPEIRDTIHHYPLAVRPKVLFPIGFYDSTLIKKEHQSDVGYVFYKEYSDTNERVNAIHTLLNDINCSKDTLSVTCLCKDNDSIEQLANTFSDKYNIPHAKVFASFDSKLLKNYSNPYHKMTCIMSQFKLVNKSPLNSTTLVFADHGDHFWQMGVVAKTLLENNLTNKVIMVFNQP